MVPLRKSQNKILPGQWKQWRKIKLQAHQACHRSYSWQLKALVSKKWPAYAGKSREKKRWPEEWGDSLTVPLYKGKGDALECGKYCGIRLLEHSFKIWEKVLEKGVREAVQIDENQFGFQPGKSTTDAIFALQTSAGKLLTKEESSNCSMFLWTWRKLLTEFQDNQSDGH